MACKPGPYRRLLWASAGPGWTWHRKGLPCTCCPTVQHMCCTPAAVQCYGQLGVGSANRHVLLVQLVWDPGRCMRQCFEVQSCTIWRAMHEEQRAGNTNSRRSMCSYAVPAAGLTRNAGKHTHTYQIDMPRPCGALVFYSANKSTPSMEY